MPPSSQQPSLPGLGLVNACGQPETQDVVVYYACIGFLMLPDIVSEMLCMESVDSLLRWHARIENLSTDFCIAYPSPARFPDASRHCLRDVEPHLLSLLVGCRWNTSSQWFYSLECLPFHRRVFRSLAQTLNSLRPDLPPRPGYLGWCV